MSDWELVFYETATGNRPVEMFLDELPVADAGRVTRKLELFEALGIRLGMPHARPIAGSDLWELRVRGRTQQRIMYVAITGRRMLLLHGFTKKTQQTPAREIRVAEQRLADHRERGRRFT